MLEIAEVLKGLLVLQLSKPLSFREKKMLDRARHMLITEICRSPAASPSSTPPRCSRRPSEGVSGPSAGAVGSATGHADRVCHHNLVLTFVIENLLPFCGLEDRRRKRLTVWAQAISMRCLYCGKSLGLLKELTDGEFCSGRHRQRYQKLGALALGQLIESRRYCGVSEPP